MHFDILINEKGGTALAHGRDTLERAVHEHLGAHVRSLHFAEGPAIGETLENILKNNPEGVLIGGGDGTAAMCGVTCVKNKIPFGIIPLGTMNLLARDLDIPTELDACLSAYKNARITKIDAGSINDNLFFCNAIIGVVPEAAAARENADSRTGLGTWKSLAETVLEDMGSDHMETMHIQMENKQRTIRAKSIIVANNAYVETPRAAADRLARRSLYDGKLMVYMAAPQNKLQSLRLLVRVALGGWPRDPAIKSFERRELTLDAASRELLVSIDGEPVPLMLPFHFKIHPRAASVIVPL